jgi:hypothetical protein
MDNIPDTDIFIDFIDITMIDKLNLIKDNFDKSILFIYNYYLHIQCLIDNNFIINDSLIYNLLILNYFLDNINKSEINEELISILFEKKDKSNAAKKFLFCDAFFFFRKIFIV